MRALASTVICSKMRHAAATGSANTAVSSSMLVGHLVQVDRRQRQILGKRPVVLADADDVAVVAVLLDPPRAPVAVPAADVDLADDALADPGRVRRRRLLDDADELVAGDAGELGVALEDLEIGAADAGAADADEALARALGRRARSVSSMVPGRVMTSAFMG